MQPKKPTRFHRIERETKFHIEDDTGHLWAVSYADFLMVLLSFFILFFSMSKKDKDTIIQIVSKAREQGLGAGDGSGRMGGQAEASSIAGQNKLNPTDLVQKMHATNPDLKWEANEKQQTVTFKLNDDIFTVGGVDLNRQGRRDLVTLLKLLQPYSADIDVIFVGHTDSKAIIAGRINAVENNFDLSALRAAQAVKVALTLGLPKNSLFTHGSADNTRTSKSLSIVITQKGAGRI